jgi:hypothetical protein
MTDILPPLTDTAAEVYSAAPVRRRRTRRTLTAVDVVAVGMVTYLGAALLNSSDLQRLAQRQPLGSHREVAVMLTDGTRSVSSAIGTDLPGRMMERLRGIPDARSAVKVSQAFPNTTPLFPTIPTPVVPSSVRKPEDRTPPTTSRANRVPAVTWVSGPTTAASTTTMAPTTTTVAPATTTTIAPKPLFAADQPVAYWYGGDSLSQGFGRSLERLAGDDAKSTVIGKGVISTGLARPDVFDWSSTIDLAITHSKINVAVVLLGANDDQDMQVGEETVGFNTPGWVEEYRRRVAALMTRADKSSVKLLWVGLPPVRQGSLDAKLKVINGIIADEATRHRNTTYIDLRAEVGSDTGGYDPYCHDEGSSQVLCRSNDGVHFTDTGYDRLAKLVMAKARSLTA